MASNPLPGLSSFLTASGKKLDGLMTNFAISNYSQSYCYQGSIVSLPYLIATSQYSAPKLEDATYRMLYDYLMRYYDRVELKVRVKYIDATTERVDLQIGGIVTEKGTSYDLSGVLRSERGNFVKWQEEVNEGAPN